VSVENGIISIGFRKVTSYARGFYPDIEVCYITPTHFYSPIKAIVNFGNINTDLPTKDIKQIAEYLANADMVCFSSMTPLADLTKKIVRAIRVIKSNTFIIWGGVHCIVYPEDAIKYADAICVGEGEYSFKQFLVAYNNGTDYYKTKNFWFNKNGKIIKNGFLPLNKPEDMESFPFPLYADNELIYKRKVGFVPLGMSEYISQLGIVYHTILAIGCPFKCIYCDNSKFTENDKNYSKLRYPSVDYIIAEIKTVLKKRPYLSNVVFMDDGFIALPLEFLQEFAEKWRKEVKLPFSLSGVIPGYVNRKKMEILVFAGMTDLRMGIQSGSDRILRFYERPNRPGLVMKSVSIISEFSDRITPTYDIILDNPIENRQDIIDTLQLLYDMPRPFVLQIYGLRVIPNTKLAEELAKRNVTIQDISKGILIVEPTLANAMVYMITVFRPPKWIFEILLKYAQPYNVEQTKHYFLLFIFRGLWLFKRGFIGLLHMNFSELPGKFGWICWKLGIIKFWRTKIQRKRFLRD